MDGRDWLRAAIKTAAALWFTLVGTATVLTAWALLSTLLNE